MTKQAIEQALAKGALLLDVRSQERYAEGHLALSQNLPLENLGQADLPADKSTPIYVHCALGIKSKEAKQILEQQGYQEVIDLGGLSDLEQLGFAIEK